MTLKSKSLRQKSSAESSWETEQLTVSLQKKYDQVQADINELKQVLQQLETSAIFEPPNRQMPLEERLQIHLQFLQQAKEQQSQIQRLQQRLTSKEKELNQLEQYLTQGKTKTTKALKRLKAKAFALKQAEITYLRAIEAFKTAAAEAWETQTEVYGETPGLWLEYHPDLPLQMLEGSHS